MINRRKGWQNVVKSLMQFRKFAKSSRRTNRQPHAVPVEFLEQRCLLTTLGTFDFEAEGGYQLTNPNDGDALLAEVSDGSGDYYTRTDGVTPLAVGGTYNLPQGSFFFAVQDTDGAPGVTTRIDQTFDAVSIAGATNLSFSVLVAEDQSGDGAEDWDADSALHFEYSIDGGAFQTILAFEASGGTNTEPAQDTNFDGLGDGTRLTDTFTQFTASIPETGNSIVVRARYIQLNAGDEDVAIDNLVISGDTAIPSLSSFVRANPTAETTNADSLVFRATFSEGVQNVDSADFAVTGTTATATVTQVDPATYDITVSGGDLAGLNGEVGLNLASGQNIQDADANALPNVEPLTDETFQVDNAAPVVTSFSPADGTTNVVDISDLVITFDENVQPGAGNITIRFASDGTVAQTIDVTGTDVTINGAEVTIDPPANLAASTDYYVNISTSAFVDASGNTFAGISDATTWRFTTAAATTVTFQQGVNGYAGTFDRLINLNASVDGSTVDTTSTAFFLDGGPNATSRADYLIRFDDILGGAGIPSGATILQASLRLRTTSSSVNSNSQTGSSYNVYRLAQSFDSSSTLDGDFGDDSGNFTPDVDGVEPEQSEADFNVGTFDNEIAGGSMNVDQAYSADVTRAVQSWVDGDTNYGLAVLSDHIDNTDGWSVHSSGSATAAFRPELIVTYALDPSVKVAEFQQGLNGYTGTTDIFLSQEGPTIDGSTVSEGFLDGDDGVAEGSNDDPYMVKFDLSSLSNVDGVLKAELVIKTGISSGSSDSSATGEAAWGVHQLLSGFTTSSTYGDFAGDFNALLGANQIAPHVARFEDIDEAELMAADITSIVKNWIENGQANEGIYIGSHGTQDGWQIFSSGAGDPDLAPMLRVTYTATATPGVTVVESGGDTSVSESGTTDSFSVVLDSEPTSDVVLTVVSGDPGEATVDTATLTFTSGNWNVPQIVTVTGVDDALPDGDQSTTITIAVDDANSDDAYDVVPEASVSVTTTDNDTPGITIVESGGSTIVSESGTTDSFSVVLDSEPASNVVLTVVSGDPDEATVDTATLTFTSGNWNTPQVVTVTGVDDALVDGNQITTITIAVDDANSDDTYDVVPDRTVSVTTTDNDTPVAVVWINEIHYDNVDGDVGEFIELAGTAGTDLTGWSIVLYNGSGGGTYGTAITPTVTIDDEGAGFGAVDVQLPVNGLQNGSPDGLALVNNLGVVVEFLSYEGSFTATDGPANGMTSTDIGVAETGTTPVGFSVQRNNVIPGTPGAWGGPFDHSPGTLNVFPAPSFAIAPLDAVKAEGNTGDTTAFTFTITRSGDTSGASDVTYAVTGAAVDGASATDFVGAAFPTATESFAAGESSKVITINVTGDTDVEPDEGFIVTLSNATAGASITTATANGTIQNDDSVAPIFEIAATDASKAEGNSGNTAFTFTVTRSGNTTGVDTVEYSVTGAAVDGANAADFEAGSFPSGVVSFLDGETTRTITVNVVGDTDIEPTEGFVVTLSNPSRSGSLSTATAAGTILDDDAPAPVVWINEFHYDDDQSGDSNEFIEVAGTAGADLSGWSIVHYNGSGGTVISTIVLSGTIDDEAGSGFGALDFSGEPGGFQNGNDGFALVNALGTVVEFISYEGTFNATEGPANGMSAVDIGAGVAENNSTPSGFSLQRNNAVPGTPGVWGGPFDDSPGTLNVFPAPSFAIASLDAIKAEGNTGDTTTFTFTITRSGDTSGANDVTYAVTGAAVDGASAADFVGATFPTATESFAAGETSKVITISVNGDTDVEPDEGFIVTLSNATGGATITTATANGTIQDDDSASVVLFINEIMIDPIEASDTGKEFFELRGTPDAVLPADVYLVILEGDSESSPGNIDHVFTLSGQQFNSNGFLAFSQTAGGWDQAFSSRSTDFENGSLTFLLIQSGTAPVVDTDVDSNNDGTLDGAAVSWTIHDSIGNIDGGATDTAYGLINVSGNGNGLTPAGSTLVDISAQPLQNGSYHPDYVARNGNSTEAAATDWVFAETGGATPNYSLAVGATTPSHLGAAPINHLGAVNNFVPPNALFVDITPTTLNENGGNTTARISRTQADISAELTVTLSSSSGRAAVSPGTVTIPAGQASATFSIDTVNNTIVDGTAAVIVTATAATFTQGTDSFDVIDDDTQNLVVTPTSLTVVEGGSATFNVSLSNQPADDVTVNLAISGDGDLSLGGTTLTFTPSNWSTAQAVTVNAAEDADTDDGVATVTVSSSGLTSINVAATEDDNDTVVQQPELTISDNSGLTDDSRVSFTTDLGRWRVGGQEVNLVRPSLPDDQHHVTITNSGSSPLTIQEIIINAPDVTTSITLGPGAGDDIVLQPGQTLQINLTFAPSLPSVTNATVIDFDLATGLIIRSNATNADANGDKPVSLKGHSTFNSDITYDGAVNLGELGILNVNFGRTSSDANFDPSADINGDGSVNLGDLGPLNVEFGRTRPAPDTTSPLGQPDLFLPDEEEDDLWASDPASEPVPLTTDTEDDAEDLLAVDSAMEDADEWLDVI